MAKENSNYGYGVIKFFKDISDAFILTFDDVKNIETIKNIEKDYNISINEDNILEVYICYRLKNLKNCKFELKYK